VLYLMLEDGERLVKKRVGRMLNGQAVPDQLDYCEVWPGLADGGVGEIERYLDRYPDALVIIDTYETLRAPDKQFSNAYRNDYAGLSPLTKMAHARNADLIVVHHTGKAERIDPLATVNGSYGLTGAVDNVVILQRVRFGTEIVLSISGRDLDEDVQLALTFDTELQSHRLEGDAETVGLTKLQALVLGILKRASDALGSKEIADRAGMQNGPNLRQLLARMVESGIARIVARGRYTAAKKDAEQQDAPDTEEPTNDTHTTNTTTLHVNDLTNSQRLAALASKGCPACGDARGLKRAMDDTTESILICRECGHVVVLEQM
jgi:hypothetical protein